MDASSVVNSGSTRGGDVREIQLFTETSQGLLLDRVLADDTVHLHDLGLTDPVGPRDGLDIDLRVPILIDEDDVCCCGEVDTESTGTRRDEEDLVGRVLLLEELDVEGSAGSGSRSVESRVFEASELHKVLEDIEHASETREDLRRGSMST